MRPILAAILFQAILAFAACGGQGGLEPSPGVTPETPTASPTLAPPIQGLAASVNVDKATYEPGEPVRMTLTIENVGTETKQLAFRDGQRYDFIIMDAAGRQVWQWAADKVFIQVLGQEAIDPGQRLVYVEEWDQRDEVGNQVPPGTYTVRGSTVGCLANTDICDLGESISFGIGGRR